MVPLKYLSNFWRALEMPLINCEINLTLTWSEKCIISSAADTCKNWYKIFCSSCNFIDSRQCTYTKLQWHQLKSVFKRAINWKKYQSKVTTQAPNQYLDTWINRAEWIDRQEAQKGATINYIEYFLILASTVTIKLCGIINFYAFSRLIY